MNIKRTIAALLAAGITVSCAAAPAYIPINSFVIEASAASAPKAPENLKVSSDENGKATLKWSKVSGADGIEVYRSASKSGSFKKVKSVSGTKTGVTLTGLTAGKTYYFKVRAYKTENGKKTYGKYSSVKSCKISDLTGVDALVKKAPVLGGYLDKLNGNYPLTTDMEITVKGDYPFAPSLNLGGLGDFNRIRVTFISPEKRAEKYFLKDGTYAIMVYEGNVVKLYHSPRGLLGQMELDDDTKAGVLSETLAIYDIPLPSDYDSLKVKSSLKTVSGKEYLYEKTYDDNGFKVEFYADKNTKEIKTFTVTIGETSITRKIREYSSKADNSLFNISGQA